MRERRPLKYILNDDDEPEPVGDSKADLIRWTQFMEHGDRQLSQDIDEGETGVKVRVSTVFLGFDIVVFREGPPVLWETMVFGGVLDGTCERYTSKLEALLGHQAMCERVNATILR